MINHQFLLLDFAYEMMLSLIEIQFILTYYFQVYGNPSISKIKLRFLSTATMLLFTSVLRVLSDPIRPAALPYATVIFSLLLLPFFRIRWEKKTLFSLILFGISFTWTILFDFLVTPLLINIWIVSIVFHGVFWIFLELAKNIGKKEHQQITKPVWLLLIMIAALSSAISILIHIISLRRDDPYSLTFEMPVLAAFLLINLSVFYLFDRFSQMVQMTKEHLLLEQQIHLQHEHYRQLEQYQQQVASLHHDIKNHIRTALHIAQTNADSNELLGYLLKVDEPLSQIEETVATGNPALDAVLNLKLSQLRYAGVKCDVKIQVPPQLFLSFEDCVIIFGNLLDNVQEACQNIPSAGRWVNIIVSYSNSALYIRIDNPINTPILKVEDGHLPDTTKKNGILHGYGLKNVRKVVERQGFIRFDCEQLKVFSVRIILYGQ